MGHVRSTEQQHSSSTQPEARPARDGTVRAWPPQDRDTAAQSSPSTRPVDPSAAHHPAVTAVNTRSQTPRRPRPPRSPRSNHRHVHLPRGPRQPPPPAVRAPPRDAPTPAVRRAAPAPHTPAPTPARDRRTPGSSTRPYGPARATATPRCQPPKAPRRPLPPAPPGPPRSTHRGWRTSGRRFAATTAHAR